MFSDAIPGGRITSMKELIDISRDLARDVDRLCFGDPVTHVYNPLVYARVPHDEDLRRYGNPGCEAVLVGMNPGPFGMAQTGVPFGDVSMARDFLGIEGPVGKPPVEHPKRPVLGFSCARKEVSGTRVWTWARERFKTADAFFRRFFVVNYCPLVFLESGGKNRTPDKLKKEERDQLYEVCDGALASTVQVLGPRLVIGIGAFAQDRCRSALGDEYEVGRILHPSPASPVANRGWAAQATTQLRELGIEC